MKRKVVENIIRDYLADNLSVICNDLSLIKKEYYLPNILGTRGFIDILAKDNKNNYVIIELKRTNEASREALHEILKYVEVLKQNKNVIVIFKANNK
jgi:RecB family endonuclease NucS